MPRAFGFGAAQATGWLRGVMVNEQQTNGGRNEHETH
jgi:hypothetical protein